MKSDRLGVIPFFGILVPGSYLAGILLLGFASTLTLFCHTTHGQAFEFLKLGTAFSVAAFFFVAYLLGMILRLFAPDKVDNWSTFFLTRIRRNKTPWAMDVFPYKNTLATRLAKDGMVKIPDLMARLNPSYGRDGNTPFFNYCKWFIAENAPALSLEVKEAEALVRFLSGTALALVLASFVSALFLMLFSIYGPCKIGFLYGGLLLISVISLCLIFCRFKHQRKKEAMMVWGCVYMIIKGGTPNYMPSGRPRNVEDAFFP
jgi:hypothetical protein